MQNRIRQRKKSKRGSMDGEHADGNDVDANGSGPPSTCTETQQVETKPIGTIVSTITCSTIIFFMVGLLASMLGLIGM